MKNNIIFSVFVIFMGLQYTLAQEKTNIHEAQFWIGYMPIIKINDRWSIYNGFHYATDNFIVGRHGLTYNISEQVQVTGGYAWLILPDPSDRLTRMEHQPWAQLVISSPLGDGWKTSQRVRYEAKFREKVEKDVILKNEYTFNHRLRYSFNTRKSLNGKVLGNDKTFVSLNNEILLDFGENIYKNYLSQFRLGLFLGYPTNNMTFQLGYMYRFAPLSTENTYRHYHGLVLWINHNFKLRP